MLDSRKGRGAGILILRTPTAVRPHTVEAASTATAAAQACNQNNPPELPRHASDKALAATELLDLYKKQGMIDDAFQLIFSEASPVASVRVQLTLEEVIRRLQAAFRERRAAATRIAACERGRATRTTLRQMRRQRWALAKLQAFARGQLTRWDLALRAAEHEQHMAARVLQSRHRRRLEGRRLQWPWKLAVMAARIQNRAQQVATERTMRGQVAAPKLKGDGLVTLRTIERTVGGNGGPARSRSWDPRAC